MSIHAVRNMVSTFLSIITLSNTGEFSQMQLQRTSLESNTCITYS